MYLEFIFSHPIHSPKKHAARSQRAYSSPGQGKVKLLRVIGHSICPFQPRPYFLNLSQVIRSVIQSTFAFPCVPCMPLAYMRPNGSAHVKRLQIAHHNAHRFAIRLTFARSRSACVPCTLCFDRIARNNDYVKRLRIRCHNAHRFAPLFVRRFGKRLAVTFHRVFGRSGLRFSHNSGRICYAFISPPVVILCFE